MMKLVGLVICSMMLMAQTAVAAPKLQLPRKSDPNLGYRYTGIAKKNTPCPSLVGASHESGSRFEPGGKYTASAPSSRGSNQERTR